MSARAVFRGTYGGKACTYTELPNPAKGSHYMSYDRDPGIGPMGFSVTPNPQDIGEPVVFCECGRYAHVDAWPCALPHGDAL